MKHSNKIVFNTIIQYIKVFISAIITLYTSRLVLDALDASNFGIYSLVGGVVSMLSFIQVTISTTTQRFLSYYQAKNDETNQIKYFNSSVLVQLFLALFLITILLLVKDVLFDHILNIPSERIFSAKFVYDCMLVSLFFNMISSSYYAALIAHENILYSTLVQLLDAILKLPVAILLYYISSDKLEFFAMGMCVIYVINFLFYYLYCVVKYNECRHFSLTGCFQRNAMKDLLLFMGWTIYGTGCIVLRNQGFAIVLNRFLGAIANSAYGIALQISGQMNFLSSAIMIAIRPQIVRLSSIGSKDKMMRMAEISSKLSFMLLCVISIPTIFKMDVLLGLWLKEVPEYTVLFCRLILIDLLLDALTIGLVEANRANGNIRNFTIVTYSVRLLAIPMAYMLLEYNSKDVVAPFLSLLLFIFLGAISRFYFFRKESYFSVHSFIKKVFIKELPALIVTILFAYLIQDINWVVFFILTMFVFTVSFYYTGLCIDEKSIIKALFAKMIFKHKNNG